MMEDRLKCRAWNIKNKIYHYDAETTYDGFGGTPVISKQTFYSLLNDDNYIVEQCTGLRDKNAKLIYEGDILNSLYRDDGCRGLYVVVWRNGSLNVDKFGKHQQNFVSISLSNLTSCEVIGNIHENADLLENKE